MRKEIINNHTVLAFLLLWIAIIITSCEYDPKGNYNVALTPPEEAPPLDVDLNIVTDTIHFYWASSINLKINEESRKVWSVVFFVDGQVVTGYRNGSLFNVVLNFDQPGIHKFKLSIIANSGSGSIADILGAEGFQYESREWTLVAENLNIYTNMSYKVDKKGLNLSWKPYDGVDKKYYRLLNLTTNNNTYPVTDSYLDPDYIGEQGDYNLYVADSNNNEYLWGSCHINKNLPALKLVNINNRIALTWNRTIFKDRITEYQVYQSDISQSFVNIGTVSSSDSIIFINTTDNYFAPFMYFYIYCVPAYEVSSDNSSLFSSYLNFVHAALPGPSFGNNINISSTGFYFTQFIQATSKTILNHYSLATDKVTSLMEHNYYSDISPNARYLLSPGDSILDLTDLNTLSIVKSVNIRSVAKSFNPFSFPRISDNGICAFVSSGVLYVYDMINDHLVASEAMSSGTLKISSTGRYISVGTDDSLKLYRVNESSVTRLAGIRKPGGYFPSEYYNFFPDNDENLYMYVAPYMYIRSSSDYSVIRSMNIGPYYFNIDFSSDKIFTALNGSEWNIYDLTSGSLLKTIKSGLGSGGTGYTILMNNIIFYTGYKYYLSN
jgi:hypothetical protein